MTRAELFDMVKERLVAVYEPRVIYLFGSSAWGTRDEQSDIDLVVIVDKSSEKPYKRAAKGIASLSGLKIPKDIIVYTSKEFNELAEDETTLCHKIKNEGIKLYEAA